MILSPAPAVAESFKVRTCCLSKVEKHRIVPVFIRIDDRLCYRLKAELRLISSRRCGLLLTCIASAKKWHTQNRAARAEAGDSALREELHSLAGRYEAADLQKLPENAQGTDEQVNFVDSQKEVVDSQKEVVDIEAEQQQRVIVLGTEAAGWDPGSSSRLYATSGFAFLFGFVTAMCGALSLAGLFFGKWWNSLKERKNKAGQDGKRSGAASVAYESPSAFSYFLKRDLRRKETVEWVNMVIGKLWKVYRLGLEVWLVGLLQPLIDNLKKPSYVRRVEIKQFNLGDEPLSVRSVERRTSRRANDLQYHIGLRYTGEARMLLAVTLGAGLVPVIIPIGVRGFDVDGEIWVKLRLIPSQPWVGTATWAFVSLPKIILALSPFGLFNIMGIPFLSRFLTKLLTVDLPQLFVRPNKVVISFLQNQGSDSDSKHFKHEDINKNFAGELSVTIVDARKLKYFRFGKTDPYVLLTLGDQVIRSKKNSQTTIIGPPGAPIWNQDFQLLVVDPKSDKLAVRVRDTVGFTVITIGYGEVDLSCLQDTVPVDKIVTLKSQWGPRRFGGEIMLRLTYKAYVEDEEDFDGPLSSNLSDSDSDSDGMDPRKQYRKRRRETFVNNFIAAVNHAIGDLGYEDVVVSSNAGSMPSSKAPVQETEEVVAHSSGAGNATAFQVNDTYTGADTAADNGAVVTEKSTANPEPVSSISKPAEQSELRPLPNMKKSRRASWRLDQNSSAVVWLGVATGIALLAALSLNFSNLVNP